MTRIAHTVFLAALVTACEPPTPPSDTRATIGALEGLAAIRDASIRIGPLLSPGLGGSEVVRSLDALSDHLESRDRMQLRRHLEMARSALSRYASRSDPALAPDLEVIRLALDAAEVTLAER